MSVFFTLFPLLSGYLLGSIPFGYFAGRIAKIDIRQHGSGNIGATNVLRVLGRGWGYTVFACDFLKGVAAVAIAAQFNPSNLTGKVTTIEILTAVAAVLGHAFPVWLNFRGGKAVATSLGVVCALAPLSALIVAALWVITFLLTRYVSVASLIAALTLPIATAFIEVRQHALNWALIVFFIALAFLICFRHRGNISRLLAGTEPRFSRR